MYLGTKFIIKGNFSLILRQNITMLRNFSYSFGEIGFNHKQWILKGRVRDLVTSKPRCLLSYVLGIKSMERFQSIWQAPLIMLLFICLPFP